jgi:four helix bundle protein
VLDHERLEVYQLARVLARESHAFIGGLPGGRAELNDQLRRATLSVALNIAEGAGEFAPREKARFYRIAKRSATECGAVLDHIADLGMVTPHQTATCKTLIRRIVGALVKLILATERTASPTAGATAPADPGTRKGNASQAGERTQPNKAPPESASSRRPAFPNR